MQQRAILYIRLYSDDRLRKYATHIFTTPLLIVIKII